MTPFAPASCPACATALLVTRLQCPACGTEVSGTFQPAGTPGAPGATGAGTGGAGAPGRLINLPEPHASLLELFLRVRGNVKDVERELRLSYPTIRARLEEAFTAARPLLTPSSAAGAAPGGPSRAERGRSDEIGATGPTPRPGGRPDSPSRERPPERARLVAQRAEILGALERGEISASEATERLRALAQSLRSN